MRQVPPVRISSAASAKWRPGNSTSTMPRDGLPSAVAHRQSVWLLFRNQLGSLVVFLWFFFKRRESHVLFPLIPVASSILAALGIYLLFWYTMLSKEDKEKADQLAS